MIAFWRETDGVKEDVVGRSDCTDANLNGVADVCEDINTIPTVSQWGLFVMALGLLAAGTLLTRAPWPHRQARLTAR